MLNLLVRSAVMFVIGALVAGLVSSAEARRRHYGYYGGGWFLHHEEDQQRSPEVQPRHEQRDTQDARPAHSGGVGGIVADLIRGCTAQAREFEGWPFDRIAEIVGPDEQQRSALEALRNAVQAKAEELDGACPRVVPPSPTAQLDDAEQSIERLTAAIGELKNPVKAFYAALNDEQKARLYEEFAAADLVDHFSRRDRWRPTAEPAHTGVPWASICERLAASLRDWPVRRLEREARLNNRQRVALYELLAAGLKAVDTLTSSCPSERALTPLARMEALTHRLAAVRAAAQIMRPPLAHLYEELDKNQQQLLAQLN